MIASRVAGLSTKKIPEGFVVARDASGLGHRFVRETEAERLLVSGSVSNASAHSALAAMSCLPCLRLTHFAS